jgi:hypothetical protein
MKVPIAAWVVVRECGPTANVEVGSDSIADTAASANAAVVWARIRGRSIGRQSFDRACRGARASRATQIAGLLVGAQRGSTLYFRVVDFRLSARRIRTGDCW